MCQPQRAHERARQWVAPIIDGMVHDVDAEEAHRGIVETEDALAVLKRHRIEDEEERVKPRLGAGEMCEVLYVCVCVCV